VSGIAGSVAEVMQIAHDTFYPHQNTGAGGGASTVLILAGVVVTLAAVVGLIWLKRRVDD
jgi:heme/copper-type cytochrome/quinol oxidase subunit 4